MFLSMFVYVCVKLKSLKGTLCKSFILESNNLIDKPKML